MSAILDRLYNLHWVTDDVARSAQPYLGFYAAFLKAHHFRSLINLRGYNARFGWWRRERAMCERLGIRHFDVKLSSRKLPPREVVANLFAAFEAAPRPVLMKCSGGQDRTSLAAALYLLDKKGASALPEAQKQFAAWPYLHLPRKRQDWLKEFPTYAAEDAGGMPLHEWARNRYDPESLEKWFASRGQTQSHQGIQRLKNRREEA